MLSRLKLDRIGYIWLHLAGPIFKGVFFLREKLHSAFSNQHNLAQHWMPCVTIAFPPSRDTNMRHTHSWWWWSSHLAIGMRWYGNENMAITPRDIIFSSWNGVCIDCCIPPTTPLCMQGTVADGSATCCHKHLSWDQPHAFLISTLWHQHQPLQRRHR